MSCHKCGSRYHKHRDCPVIKESKRKQTSCYECHELGHYRNDCPILKQRVEAEKQKVKDEKKALLEQQDKEWFTLNMPDQNKIILNGEELKKFLSSSIYGHYVLYSNIDVSSLCATQKCLDLYIKDDKISFYADTPVKRAMNNLSINDFITYLGKNGHFTKISFSHTKLSLYDISSELIKNNIIQHVEKEFNREWHYVYQGTCLWKSRRHGEDYKSKFVEEYIPLLCELYDNYKNDGSRAAQDIMSVNYEINIIYNDL